eukprot:3094498-Pyramimonas_sp.AAC.1
MRARRAGGLLLQNFRKRIRGPTELLEPLDLLGIDLSKLLRLQTLRGDHMEDLPRARCRPLN